jgi:hypothetical protein
LRVSKTGDSPQIIAASARRCDERRRLIAFEERDARLPQRIRVPARSVARLQVNEPAKIIWHWLPAQVLGGKIKARIARRHEKPPVIDAPRLADVMGPADRLPKKPGQGAKSERQTDFAD